MLKYEMKNNKNYICFDSVKSIKKISDLIMILNKISLTDNHNVIFDFSNMKEQSYSSVHVSIAGIAQYYQEEKGFEILFVERDGSYVSHTDLKSPLEVDVNKELFKENIFDKVVFFQIVVMQHSFRSK